MINVDPKVGLIAPILNFIHLAAFNPDTDIELHLSSIVSGLIAVSVNEILTRIALSYLSTKKSVYKELSGK